MSAILAGQILGVAMACGLNLYATVAALGLLARTGLILDLPPALRGLESAIVITTALILFFIEAVVDRVPHLDSLWDAVHTLVRPTAAALLAFGILWAAPDTLVAAGVALALVAALAVHTAKAGLRVALNASRTSARNGWISTGEDIAAIGLAFVAFQLPEAALAAAAAVALALLVTGPRLWRAFAFGIRCINAWIRTLFRAPRWIEGRDLPGGLRRLLPPLHLGAGQPRATRVAATGLPRVGAFRNGWLVLTMDGPVFLYRARLKARRIDLPAAHTLDPRPGVWANTILVTPHQGRPYTLFLLKDGPAPDMAAADLKAHAA